MSKSPTPGALKAATAITQKINTMMRIVGVITSDPAKTIPGPAELRARHDMAVGIDEATGAADALEIVRYLAGLSEEPGCAHSWFRVDCTHIYRARALVARLDKS